MEDTDHDLLIRLNERVDELTRRFDTYMKQRWALTLVLVAANLSLIVGLLAG